MHVRYRSRLSPCLLILNHSFEYKPVATSAPNVVIRCCHGYSHIEHSCNVCKALSFGSPHVMNNALTLHIEQHRTGTSQNKSAAKGSVRGGTSNIFSCIPSPSELGGSLGSFVFQPLEWLTDLPNLEQGVCRQFVSTGLSLLIDYLSHNLLELTIYFVK